MYNKLVALCVVVGLGGGGGGWGGAQAQTDEGSSEELNYQDNTIAVGPLLCKPIFTFSSSFLQSVDRVLFSRPLDFATVPFHGPILPLSRGISMHMLLDLSAFYSFFSAS